MHDEGTVVAVLTPPADSLPTDDACLEFHIGQRGERVECVHVQSVNVANIQPSVDSNNNLLYFTEYTREAGTNDTATSNRDIVPQLFLATVPRGSPLADSFCTNMTTAMKYAIPLEYGNPDIIHGHNGVSDYTDKDGYQLSLSRNTYEWTLDPESYKLSVSATNTEPVFFHIHAPVPFNCQIQSVSKWRDFSHVGAENVGVFTLSEWAVCCPGLRDVVRDGAVVHMNAGANGTSDLMVRVYNYPSADGVHVDENDYVYIVTRSDHRSHGYMTAMSNADLTSELAWFTPFMTNSVTPLLGFTDKGSIDNTFVHTFDTDTDHDDMKWSTRVIHAHLSSTQFTQRLRVARHQFSDDDIPILWLADDDTPLKLPANSWFILDNRSRDEYTLGKYFNVYYENHMTGLKTLYLFESEQLPNKYVSSQELYVWVGTTRKSETTVNLNRGTSRVLVQLELDQGRKQQPKTLIGKTYTGSMNSYPKFACEVNMTSEGKGAFVSTDPHNMHCPFNIPISDHLDPVQTIRAYLYVADGSRRLTNAEVSDWSVTLGLTFGENDSRSLRRVSNAIAFKQPWKGP